MENVIRRVHKNNEVFVLFETFPLKNRRENESRRAAGRNKFKFKTLSNVNCQNEFRIKSAERRNTQPIFSYDTRQLEGA